MPFPQATPFEGRRRDNRKIVLTLLCVSAWFSQARAQDSTEPSTEAGPNVPSVTQPDAAPRPSDADLDAGVAARADLDANTSPAVDAQLEVPAVTDGAEST